MSIHALTQTTVQRGRGISLLVRLGRLVFGSVLRPTYASRFAGEPEVVTDHVYAREYHSDRETLVENSPRGHSTGR